MSTTYEQSWNSYKCEFTLSGVIGADEPIFSAFMRLIVDMNRIVPLDKFKIEQTGTNPREHLYDFKAHDGRRYKQRIRVPEGPDFQGTTLMTFDVDDFFTRDELAPHREVRDEVINLIATRGLEKIEVDF